MRKTLLGFVFGVSLGLFGANAYSQSSQDKIDDRVKAEALKYLNYASNSDCGSVPDVSLVVTKLEDRENKSGLKDGVKDSAFLYRINNPCKGWSNVPSYFVRVVPGKKDGTFEDVGYFEESGIRSRDEKDDSVMPKEW